MNNPSRGNHINLQSLQIRRHILSSHDNELVAYFMLHFLA